MNSNANLAQVRIDNSIKTEGDYYATRRRLLCN